VDVGISVSRVGGNAQRKAMKRVAGSLRLDLAAFRDLEAFAQLGTELDAATQRQLDRGQRMVELLKQPQFQPFPLAEQVISIFAGTQGLLDDLAVADVSRFEAAMLQHFRDQHAGVLDQIATTGELPNELAEQVTQVVRDFKTQFK
jgi:F-type H+-transporting ATPase subunit alpha